MREFQGRVAVVTGAASGIGLALAKRFAAEGMKVVLADVEAPALAKATAELSAGGARALAVPTDVSRAESVEALARRTLDQFGAVDLLCNNAGVFVGGAAWEHTLGDWQWLLGVNLWGVIHGIRTFVPIMLGQKGDAWIVNTASGAGLMSLPMSAAYNVTKHAVVTLSETLYHDLRLRGASIGVSVLCPGPIATNIPDAARNRPAEFGTSSTTVAEGALREFLRTGMPPAEVAEIVLRGVREGRFYLLTHPGMKRGIRTRMEEILEDRPPTSPTLRRED